MHHDALGQRVLESRRIEPERVFAYDGQGQLVSVDYAAMRWPYEYDALGRRVRKTNGTEEWRFGWLDSNLIWEEHRRSPDQEPVRRSYLYLPDSYVPIAFREQGRTCWMQTDCRGAVTAVWDERGDLVWLAAYDSYGVVHIEVEDVRQPWRLLGQYDDSEVGLYSNLARFYDPRAATFLSIDPQW